MSSWWVGTTKPGTCHGQAVDSLLEGDELQNFMRKNGKPDGSDG